ncbi:MAG: DNA primase [Clostridiales bacterium]|nr:DNA primase [Clostridiales bacterium]
MADSRDYSSFISELKERNDIASVVGEYVKLTRKGRQLWGLCPFHSEKTPSFSVNTDMQIYKCFGCGKGGDVITFIREVEHLEFNEAVEFLAKRVGMKVETFKGRQETQTDVKRRMITQVMAEAARFYIEKLSTPEAKIARDYLNSRGVPADISKKFMIGFAPAGWNNLRDHLLSKNFSEAVMLEAGLVSKGNKGVYDRFRNRLMFPICDDDGTVLAFGGRRLNEADEQKYINSPQTLIYNKSNTLYGLNVSKNFGREAGLIVVEGYFDVITMHQFGFNTAVASCGTSLTTYQARKLKRYTNKVLIGYDGDGAGQAATVRGLEILKSVGLDVRVLNFPDGCDPDDTLRRYGGDYMKGVVDKAQELNTFLLGNTIKKFDLSNEQGRSRAAAAAVEIIVGMDSQIERERYIRAVAKKTGFSENAIAHDVNRILASKNEPQLKKPVRTLTPSDGERAASVPPKDDLEIKLINHMVINEEAARKVLKVVNEDCFYNQDCKKIILGIQRVFKLNEEFNTDSIMYGISDEERASLYSLFFTEVVSSDIVNDSVLLASKLLARHYDIIAAEMQVKANELIKHGGYNSEECQSLLKEIVKYKKLSKMQK